jgi:hypothetical protein
LAERVYGWTPYRYGFNNPISYIDPDGMFETVELAREHKRQAGISGRVRRQNDGTYAIHHRGTNGGIRTFNDSQFGATTAVVFEHSGPKYTQKGGNPIPGSGTYETNVTAEHTGPPIDPTGLGGRGGAGRFSRPGSLGMVVANLLYRIQGLFQETNEPAGNINSVHIEEPANSHNLINQTGDPSMVEDSVIIQVTDWKKVFPRGSYTGSTKDTTIHKKDIKRVRRDRGQVPPHLQ